MSFLDERDEPPRRPPGRRPPGGAATDRQTLMVRRAIAAGVGLLVLLLIVLGIRGCVASRKEQAFKDYVQDAAALQNESLQQSEGFFKLLREPGDQSAADVQNAANGFQLQAEQLVDRARGTDRPDEVGRPHASLVEALEFRRDGLGAIARLLPTALGDEGRSAATQSIAAQMRNFDASDVIYTERFVPGLLDALEDEDLVDDVPVPEELKETKGFLDNIDWLRPTTVADRISRVRGGGGGRASTPGLHGTGLGTVTAKPGGQTLTADRAAAIKVSENLSFDVQIQNQGENDEEDITVKVTITGGGKPIELEDQLDAIAAGETKTVSVPLAETPPLGRAVTVRIEIQPVPGEQKTDNNKGSFQAIFTR